MNLMNMHNQQQQMGSGLTRYRSAPSSYFASLLNSNNDTTSGGGGVLAEEDEFEQLFDPRFVNPTEPIRENRPSDMGLQIQSQSELNLQYSTPVKRETEVRRVQRRSNDYASVSDDQMMFRNRNSGDSNSVVDDSYDRLLGPIGSTTRVRPIKADGGGGNLNLIRRSSSPAGLFDSINIENEFGSMRSAGNFGQASYSSANRFNNKMDFSSLHPSSSGSMPPISEVSSKRVRENNPLDDDHGNGDDYIPGFSVNPWEDSDILSDNFLQGIVDKDSKTFSNVNDQNTEGGNRPTTLLSHHLSLPKSPAMEMLLQDSIPCKIRAKRGCATHPRSIAERVRRTKISERMRKLQDLVPNMEKQTNTSDMLDLAVDYIKNLQTQVKILSDNRANCTCLAKQNHRSNDSGN